MYCVRDFNEPVSLQIGAKGFKRHKATDGCCNFFVVGWINLRLVKFYCRKEIYVVLSTGKYLGYGKMRTRPRASFTGTAGHLSADSPVNWKGYCAKHETQELITNIPTEVSIHLCCMLSQPDLKWVLGRPDVHAMTLPA